MDQQTLIQVTKGYRVQRAKRRARRRALVLGATATGAFVAGRRSAQRRQAVEKRRIKPSRRTRRLMAATALLGGAGAIWAAHKHPRGPKGRFRETPDLLDASEAYRRTRRPSPRTVEHFEHVELRLDGMSPEGRQGVLRSLQRFAGEHPETFRRIARIEHDPQLHGNNGKPAAGRAYVKPGPLGPIFGIALNEHDFEPERLWRSKLPPSASRTMRAEHRLEVTTTHELGHVLAMHGESRRLYAGLPPRHQDFVSAAVRSRAPGLTRAAGEAQQRYYDEGWDSNDPDASRDRIGRKHPAVTKYALSNAAEFFAENYAALHHPDVVGGKLIAHPKTREWIDWYRSEARAYDREHGFAKAFDEQVWIPLCDGYPVFGEDGPQDIIDLVAKVIRKKAPSALKMAGRLPKGKRVSRPKPGEKKPAPPEPQDTPVDPQLEHRRKVVQSAAAVGGDDAGKAAARELALKQLGEDIDSAAGAGQVQLEGIDPAVQDVLDEFAQAYPAAWGSVAYVGPPIGQALSAASDKQQAATFLRIKGSKAAVAITLNPELITDPVEVMWHQLGHVLQIHGAGTQPSSADLVSCIMGGGCLPKGLLDAYRKDDRKFDAANVLSAIHGAEAKQLHGKASPHEFFATNFAALHMGTEAHPDTQSWIDELNTTVAKAFERQLPTSPELEQLARRKYNGWLPLPGFPSSSQQLLPYFQQRLHRKLEVGEWSPEAKAKREQERMKQAERKAKEQAASKRSKPAAKKTSKPSSKVAKVSFRQHRQRKDAAAKSRNARRRRRYATGLAVAGLLTSAKLIESPSARTGLKDSVRHPERGAKRVKAGAMAMGETADPRQLKRAAIIGVRNSRRSFADAREGGTRKPWVADGMIGAERYLAARYKRRYRRRAGDIAGRAKPRGEVKKMVDGGPAALHVNGPLKIRRKRKGKQESIIVGARVQKLKPVKGKRLTAAQRQQRVNAGKASAAKRRASVADKPSSSRGRREYDEKAAFRRTLHRVALYGGVAAATGALSRSGDFRQSPYADDDSLEFRVGFGERNRGLRVYRRPAGYGRRTYGRSPIVERKRIKVEMDNRDGVSRAVYVSVPNPIKLRKMLAEIQQTKDPGLIAKHPGHDQREHGRRHRPDPGRRTVGRKRANRGGRNVQGSDLAGRYTSRSRKRNRRHAVRVLGGVGLSAGVGLAVGSHVNQQKEINRLNAADQAFYDDLRAAGLRDAVRQPNRQETKAHAKASRKR